MLKLKIKPKRKQAQQIVELALAMPMFIILFSYTFQLMVETYSKYRFSYLFTNSVRRAIEEQPVYTTLEDKENENYNIATAAHNILNNVLLSNGQIPFTRAETGLISIDNTSFIVGAYALSLDRLFFRNTGTEYFYFIIPVSRVFSEPLVLNYSQAGVHNFFERYYDASATRTEGNATPPREDEGGEGDVPPEVTPPDEETAPPDEGTEGSEEPASEMPAYEAAGGAE